MTLRTALTPRTALILPPAALIAGLLSFGPDPAHAESMAHVPSEHAMHVMKTPACGCCAAWVDIAREEGFEVEVTDTEDYEGMKALVGVPGALWSCHTARIEGYTVEGHVPFAALRKLLDERPDVSGIAVPGMPMGSPGMGDDPTARYDVLAYGGTAGAGEVFFRAGVDDAPQREAPGFLDRLFGD